jgi:sugar lactone lactonase YvrE
LVVVGVGTAFADEPAPSPATLPTSQGVIEAIESHIAQPLATSVTDQAVAEELPHQDLGRDEARELLEGVFEVQLENPAGIFNDLSATQFLAPDVAVVPIDAGETPNAEVHSGSAEVTDAGEDEGELAGAVLLDSTMPLRTESPSGQTEIVDLSLEPREGELQPANPLTEVGIPQELGDGITLPGPGVTIELAGAPEGRTASVVDQSVAFLPNVATDTDLVIAPTPTGVETLTHLRSADAPLTQTFDLQLPSGANLQVTEDGGAAVLDKDGNTLISVSAPTAIDAAGEDVPVSLGVKGNSLILATSPDASTEFPVLVDPLYQTYDWAKSQHWQSGICNSSHEFIASNSCNNREEWGYEHIENNSPPLIRLDNRAYGSFPPVPQGTPGLFIETNGSLSAGDRGTMNYTVPRFFSDQEKYGVMPTSFIQAIKLSNLDWNAFSGSLSPYMSAGIWDTINGGWISYYTHEGLTGHGLTDMNFQYHFANPGNSNGKVAAVTVNATESKPNQNTELYVGNASIELADNITPTAGPISGPSEWVDQTAAPITFTASDSGLGAQSLVLTDQAVPPHVWKTSRGCIGVGGAACPRHWKSTDAGGPALKYEPSLMPQGINYVSVVAEDPVGNRSAPAYAEIKVDHTGPGLSFGGTATEQAAFGTYAPLYTLKYTASDGDSAEPTALTPFGTPGTGVGKTQRPMAVAISNAGNVFVVDRECNCVQKYDPTGKFLSQFGSPGSGNGQFSDPRGIAIAANGNLWVSEAGNKRVQQFTPGGAYLRKITYGGFSEPYGLAMGPGETLWVADAAAHRVMRFNQSGTLLHEALGAPAAGALAAPVGVASDPNGNIWMTDNANHRIVKFDATGNYITQFGSEGTGSGRLKGPVGITVAPSGSIMVVDAGSNRLQEFRSGGDFLRQFASAGSASNQLSEPRGMAFGPGNTAYVADAANKRIAKWSHASYDPQSGVASTEVKIDGQLVEPKYAPGCGTKDCEITREWTLDADDYNVGVHHVSVTATDGVGSSTTKTQIVETHGDLVPPTIALSGSMTEQPSLGTTRPAYALKVTATDPGGGKERKSGIASTTIKVDGSVVDSTAPGCSAGGCAISRDWTLNSDNYSAGVHTVQVSATDEAGRVTTKSLAITINRDTSPPQLAAPNTFFTAPEGWVEQQSYVYSPSATDANGYGVTSIVLKIDGAVAKTASQLCPNGGCGINPVDTIDMAPYPGGAHLAELIATDGAGNTAKKTWTMNVNPDGSITPGEAQDTLEAVDTTADSALVAPTDEVISPQERADGNDPSLVLVGGDLESRGVPNPSAIETDPDGGFIIVLPETKVEAEPVDVGVGATDLEITEDVAGVSANVSPNVDTVTRPLYSGLLTFTNIRDTTGSESFSWEVNLGEGQTLVSIDPMDVELRFANGMRAMLIAAERAHDAVGTEVPTSLSVSEGNVLTLTVGHRGGNYVYPVIAGAGWEGGYTTELIVGPKDEQEVKEEQERIEKERQEALELTWIEEIAAGSDEPPWTEPQGIGNTSPMRPKILRFRIGAPEMVDWKQRKRRSKANPVFCAHLSCDIWRTELVGTWFWNGVQGRPGGYAWRGDTLSKCYSGEAWWVDNDLRGIGWGGPNPAPYGYGQHLTLFCNFAIEWLNATGPEEDRFQMYSHLYGSGYEGKHIFKYPPLVLEG